MKKYFLHNGTTHEGPFDFEEIKAREITSETAVWYDGLDDWTTAGKVEELKVLIKTPQRKKIAISRILAFVALLVIFAVVFFLIGPPKPVPKKKILPTSPDPIVVIQSPDFSREGLLKLKATIYTTILNQGAAGKVLVTFKIQQNGHHYEKSKSIFLKENESQKLQMTFDEAKILEGDVESQVVCKAEK
jgi:hypothetical protein